MADLALGDFSPARKLQSVRMDPVVNELHIILARVKRLERRIMTDPRLIAAADKCCLEIDLALTQHFYPQVAKGM